MKKLSALLLVLFCAFILVACAPKDSGKAKEKMEEAGYSCIATVLDEKTESGMVANVTGSKSLLKDTFTATLYDSAKNAKAAATNAEGNIPDGTYVVGKWVFVGTEEAYKAFKK